MCVYGPISVKARVFVNVLLCVKVSQHLSVPTEQVHVMTGHPHLSICASLCLFRWLVNFQGQIVGFFLEGQLVSRDDA